MSSESEPPPTITEQESKNVVNCREFPLDMNCKLCKRPGDLACSSCLRIVYCSEEHQEEDWSNHQIYCANYSLRRSPYNLYQGPFKIIEKKSNVENPNNSSSPKVKSVTDDDMFVMTAQVTIPPNEKIMDEVPIIIAPWPRTKLRQCEDFRNQPRLRLASLTCFGCCGMLDLKCRLCYHCNLPLCSMSECPFVRTHLDNECKCIKKYQEFRKKATEKDPRTYLAFITEEEIEFVYQDVMMVRLILYFVKEERKEFGNDSCEAGTKFQGFKGATWTHLNRLWNLHEEIRKTESTRGAVTLKHLHLMKLFPYSLFLVNFDKNIVWRLFCILEANAFTFNMAYQRFNVLCSILPKVQHSCFPNAHAFLTFREPTAHSSTDFNKLFSVTVKSGRTISKGALITISYLPLVYSIFERRLILLDRYFFWCRCERCLDCTEKGTFTSSNICQKCCRGYVMPSLEFLMGSPGPKPLDIFSITCVREAENQYKNILSSDFFGWSCSVETCANDADRKPTQFKKTTVQAMERYRNHEIASVKCLGKFDATARFRWDCQTELHSNHSIILKLTDDMLRGEVYPLTSELNKPNLNEPGRDYIKSVVLAFEAYKSYMSIVNPAFEFQGFPTKILQELRGDYNRREKPSSIQEMTELFSIHSY